MIFAVMGKGKSKMARYIDADRLLNEVTGNGGIFVYGIDTIKAFISRITAQPTADVQEVKHGEWYICCDGYYPFCSICSYEPEPPRFHNDNRTPYCPNCGAKMDGGKNE